MRYFAFWTRRRSVRECSCNWTRRRSVRDIPAISRDDDRYMTFLQLHLTTIGTWREITPQVPNNFSEMKLFTSISILTFSFSIMTFFTVIPIFVLILVSHFKILALLLLLLHVSTNFDVIICFSLVKSRFLLGVLFYRITRSFSIIFKCPFVSFVCLC